MIIVIELINEQPIALDTRSKKLLSNYQAQELAKCVEKENVFDSDHFVKDCMDEADIAVKGYTYFLVRFGDNKEIICTNYGEFKKLYEEM